jgi:hypothetical protein
VWGTSSVHWSGPWSAHWQVQRWGGVLVGCAVGAAVGVLVGRAVGAAVGVLVGFDEGAAVGATAGFLLGLFVSPGSVGV